MAELLQLLLLCIFSFRKLKAFIYTFFIRSVNRRLIFINYVYDIFRIHKLYCH